MKNSSVRQQPSVICIGSAASSGRDESVRKLVCHLTRPSISRPRNHRRRSSLPGLSCSELADLVAAHAQVAGTIRRRERRAWSGHCILLLRDDGVLSGSLYSTILSGMSGKKDDEEI